MKNVFSGFSLEDVLLLIGIKASSGELVIESGNNIGSVIFNEGKILQASSPYSRAIGDLLVENGLISDAELMETLKVQKKNPHIQLGALLRAAGKVDFEVIEMMVQGQIRQAVSEFRTWQSPDFSFTEKDTTPFDTINLPVNEFILSDSLKTAMSSLDVTARMKGRSASTPL